MKKTILFCAVILSFGIVAALVHFGNCAGDKKDGARTEAAAVMPESHDCADCPAMKKAAAGEKKINCPLAEKAKKPEKKMCPGHMKGVEKAVKNADNGVEITMTAKDKETAAKIQKMAAEQHADKAGMKKDCPCHAGGAEVKTENTEYGVKVTITGKTPESVKKIQAAAAKNGSCDCGGHDKPEAKVKAAAKYMCAMKCVESDKPGKCPKCGMPMGKVK